MNNNKITELKYKKWNKWLCSIYNEIDQLIFYQRIFKETNRVIKKNNQLEKENNFYALFNAGYVFLIVSIIRRLVKNDKGSLKKLLLDISKNIDVLKHFNKNIQLKKVLFDIKELEKHTKIIEDFADNHVAHKKISENGIIRFETIEKAINIIKDTYDYYGNIIGANHLEIDNYKDKRWLSIFKQPWIIE